jgi:hypothetical protein
MKTTKFRSGAVLLTGLGILVTGIASACYFRAANMQENSNQVPKAPSESTEQIRGVLAKEFGGLMDIDDRTISPTFLMGDFNGDGVADLAIAVRVNREIDPEDPSEMPFRFEKAYGPGPSTVGEPDYGPSFTIGVLAHYRRNNFSMLAIIHGTRELGFTETMPQQRILVVDAWHLGKKRMSLFKGKLEPAAYGDEPETVAPPQLLGDAILMIGPENSGTAVYWDGARYRWYPVDGLTPGGL